MEESKLKAEESDCNLEKSESVKLFKVKFSVVWTLDEADEYKVFEIVDSIFSFFVVEDWFLLNSCCVVEVCKFI